MTSLLLLKSMLFASAFQQKKRKIRSKKKYLSRNTHLKMCRVCNKQEGVVPIFNNSIQSNISKEITNFSGITISESDKFSKHLCKSCLGLLNGCIRFRDMCQRTNKQINGLSIKKETNEESSEAAKYDEDTYNVLSPSYSEDNSGVWGCTTCSTDFYDMDSYNKHLAECNATVNNISTTNEEACKKTFLCDICGKVARSNANLLVHMSIHENIFPFKCEECPYQGRTMDLLKVHKRTHMVDKPFKCSQCPKSTTTSSNLAKHMRHVHSTNRPYKCTYCDKAFSYQHDMKRHVRDIHLRQGTVECDVCFKKFNTKKILQGHRWKVHKIKGERHGRLPSYLQCQMEEQTDSNKIQEYETIVY